jgi:hypothetical protein
MTRIANPSPHKTFIQLGLLEPGDVILTGEPGIRSRMVSLASGGQYSHVSLYLGLALLFESQGDGVGTTPIQVHVGIIEGREAELWDVSHYRIIDVFRTPDTVRDAALNFDELSRILMDAVAGHWGKEYPHLTRLADASVYPSGLKKLLRSGLGVIDRLGLAGSRKFAVGPFCSELVADCFETIGWSVFNGERQPHQVAPNTFADPHVSLLKKLDVKAYSVQALPAGRPTSRSETAATMFNELNQSLYGRAPNIEAQRRLRVLGEFFKRVNALEVAAGRDAAAAVLRAAFADLDSGPLAAVMAPPRTPSEGSVFLQRPDGSAILHVDGRGTWSIGPEPETISASDAKSDSTLRDQVSSTLNKITDELVDRRSIAHWLDRPVETWPSSAQDAMDQAEQAFNAGNFSDARGLFAAAAKLFGALKDSDRSSTAWLNLAQSVYANADTERAYLHARDLAKALAQRGYLAGSSQANLIANASLLAAEAGFYASEFLVKGEAWVNLIREALRALTVASLHLPSTPEPQVLERFVSISVVLAIRAHVGSPISEAVLRKPFTVLTRHLKRCVPGDFGLSGDALRTQQARQAIEMLSRRYGSD